MVVQTNIICCDWGTSSFRLRVITLPNGDSLAESETKEGISVVHKEWLAIQSAHSISKLDFFIRQLNNRIVDLVHSLDDTICINAVIVSGMASSSIGLVELPYAKTPFSLTGEQVVYKKIEAGEYNPYPIWIISGLRSDDEVMRGEETQLIGIGEILNELNQESITCVFPGTHSKHLQISKGVATGFQTYMTGELFQLLSGYSVLSNSVSAADTANLSDSEEAAFTKGVGDSTHKNLLNTIFTVRTNQLFNRLGPTENSCYLSGLLIGAELRTLKEKQSGQIVLACGKPMFHLYRQALIGLGLQSVCHFLDPEKIEEAAMLGQLKLYNHVFQNNNHENK